LSAICGQYLVIGKGIGPSATEDRQMNILKKTRFSVRNAVASFLGEDGRECEVSRRYQPTRTPCPIYTSENDYLTATSSNMKKPKDDQTCWCWELVQSAEFYGSAFGWAIWVSSAKGDVA